MLKCRTAMMNLQRLKSIRRYLIEETAKVLVLGLVLSHLRLLKCYLHRTPRQGHKSNAKSTKCSCKNGIVKNQI